jgi:hypothetical protein
MTGTRLQRPHPVTPDLIRGPALFPNLCADRHVAEGSWTPDRVRGDAGVSEVSR